MKQTIPAVLIILAWLILTGTQSATAWSEDGHHIVCAIAWKELLAETRAWVGGLLLDDPASTFAEACVWADAIWADPADDWAKPHHDVNVPAGAASIDPAGYPWPTSRRGEGSLKGAGAASRCGLGRSIPAGIISGIAGAILILLGIRERMAYERRREVEESRDECDRVRAGKSRDVSVPQGVS